MSKKLMVSYLSPKLEAARRPEMGGFGVYVKEPVQSGDLLAVWGGRIVNGEELDEYPEIIKSLSIQVEEDLFQIPISPSEPADCINHSCAPNAGMSGQIALVAMRDIQPGEDVCFDYAMSDGSPYDEFDCACGAPTCRGRITGNDWMLPELWERYKGYFSPYIQRRIDKMKGEI